ncbi:hypothetical protein [Bacillus sp. B-jedd]|uniref:hypothetical protein n=1 Tax=Bacillus sp. B-jedd TaxID=1476857 RepID=UPI0005156F07|nr:hypothetical protein [Bacillus sp. B-jedd]CEG29680.1 hypothetical protein BN1002_04638 [Bacillus sp. B-jedd]
MSTQVHPTIRKCLQHLEIIEANDKVKQIVYMYMESLYKELNAQKDEESNNSGLYD